MVGSPKPQKTTSSAGPSRNSQLDRPGQLVDLRLVLQDQLSPYTSPVNPRRQNVQPQEQRLVMLR